MTHNIFKGDPKIVDKYQWRQGQQFGNGNEVDSDSDDEEFEHILQATNAKIEENDEVKKVRKSNEAGLDKEYYELPDLESLSLMGLESCAIQPFGSVFQHHDALVMIKPYPNVPYLDLDTMLFNSQKVPVGRIYELMGLVTDPIYNILLPSTEEAAKLYVGLELFYASAADESITKMLHLQDLRNKSAHVDEGLNDSEDDEEEYYGQLRKQLEDYESRKRKMQYT